MVELTGGNDGLNTVIPYADDLYHKARPTLRQTKDVVVKLDTFYPRSHPAPLETCGCVADVDPATGNGVQAELHVEQSYRNMREVLERHPRVIAHAQEAIRRAGLEPVSKPIRGGTDGAQRAARQALAETPGLTGKDRCINTMKRFQAFPAPADADVTARNANADRCVAALRSRLLPHSARRLPRLRRWRCRQQCPAWWQSCRQCQSLALPVSLRRGEGAKRHQRLRDGRLHQDSREIEMLRLPVLHLAHFKTLYLSDHLVDGAKAQLRHDLQDISFLQRYIFVFFMTGYHTGAAIMIFTPGIKIIPCFFKNHPFE